MCRVCDGTCAHAQGATSESGDMAPSLARSVVRPRRRGCARALSGVGVGTDEGTDVGVGLVSAADWREGGQIGDT